jgi:aspartate racemase
MFFLNGSSLGELNMAKRIGILACSAEGAALCYRTIAEEGSRILGPHMHPHVIMDSLSMGEWMPSFNSGNYEAVGKIMHNSIQRLVQAGVDVVVCPDNSAHLAFHYASSGCPVPWLHIADAVLEAAVTRKFKRCGLLGTRFTMRGPVYKSRFEPEGIAIITPGPDQQEVVDRIIFEELVNGRFEENSRRVYNNVIQGLRDDGCDSVILGCTEIPLLIQDDDCPLPVLDSTRLLARAAVRFSVSESAWIPGGLPGTSPNP